MKMPRFLKRDAQYTLEQAGYYELTDIATYGGCVECCSGFQHLAIGHPCPLCDEPLIAASDALARAMELGYVS